ncbi:23S rRNA (guanosine(2251)-2'-O)-methyltransferase RlmB [Egicoccus halophilus]|uniref:23S rRNA (Guanosine(2251)-2'-O)-methyltransferase RlmB n=1 Tax=Egicoccus halophilus TaxID=1670830 RepID=A0A8J3AFB1_9ACTN|nr:23S rRNA (guanosine(2251)-2'-O)-methyltransferase RlmB [Egicoccus halophilus]GGI07806.1 23S rRNA (guanosine(2251)-2'-O)-methyltransferase RlmB [Egicoccus halophilus]
MSPRPPAGNRRGRNTGRGPRPAGREHRDERLVAGLHPVRELLRAGAAVRRLLVADTRDASAVLDEILALARTAGVPVEEVERHRIDERAEGLVHQGVLALAPPFPYATLDDARRRAADEPLLLVALDSVTDPHNLGSIARSADAVGAHGLLVPERRAASVTTTAEKAAAGALAHLPVVQVTNLVRTIRALQGEGVWAVGLDGEAPTAMADSRLLGDPLVLVVGAEGRGLSRLAGETCDELVHLPMRGAVGSLNASVAAAVALYEVLRHRG